MVKGITRQVIVVKPPDAELFDQAIFILKDRAAISDEQILDHPCPPCPGAALAAADLAPAGRAERGHTLGGLVFPAVSAETLHIREKCGIMVANKKEF